MHRDTGNILNFPEESAAQSEFADFLRYLEDCDPYQMEHLLPKEEQCTPAPACLTEQIMREVYSPKMQLGQTVKKTSLRMELFFLGARTAVGVLASLLLLFALPALKLPDFSSARFLASHERQLDNWGYAEEDMSEKNSYLQDFTQSISSSFSQGTRKITDYYNSFSNKLLNGGR